MSRYHYAYQVERNHLTGETYDNGRRISGNGRRVGGNAPKEWFDLLAMGKGMRWRTLTADGQIVHSGRMLPAETIGREYEPLKFSRPHGACWIEVWTHVYLDTRGRPVKPHMAWMRC